jgi:DNA invertase Pin-like site-specific DNA recombinase
VSTEDQDLALQLDALRAAGCGVVHEDRMTGAQRERPGIEAALADAAAGDTLVVWRLDRLGRSVLHLSELADGLQQRQVGLRSLSDGVDTTSTAGRLLYGILSSLAEFERETIRERVKAGMAAARARGRLVGRRRALRPEHVADARAKMAAGMRGKEVARFFGVSRATLYRALARES